MPMPATPCRMTRLRKHSSNRGRLAKRCAMGGAGLALAISMAACGSSPSSSSASTGSTSSKGTTSANKATSTTTTAPATLTTVKIGYPLPNVQSVAMQLGVKEGIFKKAGLNVTTASIGTSNVVTAALTSGSLDYSINSASSTIAAVKKGAGIITISSYTIGTPVNLIVSTAFAKSHTITTKTPAKTIVHDLVGAKVGVSSPVIVKQLNVLLGGYTVQPSQVSVVTVSSEGVLGAELKAGQFDAFIAGPPVPQVAAANGAGVVVLSSKNAAPWDAGNANLVLDANKTYAAAHPALTKKVVEAVHEAVQFVLQHADQAAGDSTTLLTATKAVISESLPLAGYASCGRMTTSLWTKTVKFSINAGDLPAGSTAPKGTVWTNQYMTSQCG